MLVFSHGRIARMIILRCLSSRIIIAIKLVLIWYHMRIYMVYSVSARVGNFRREILGWSSLDSTKL